MKQLELEREMSQLGASRTRRRNYQAQVKGRDHATTAGSRMLRELAPLVTKAIQDWVKGVSGRAGRSHKAIELMEQIDIRMAASLTLRVLIDSIATSRPYTRTAMFLGGLLEDDWLVKKFRNECRKEWDTWKRRSKGLQYSMKLRSAKGFMRAFSEITDRWDPDQKCALGVVLIELAVQATGICEIVHVRHGKRVDLVLEPSLQALEWMEQQNSGAEELSPLYLPFVEPPLDWIDPTSGGFHSETVYSSALVKTTDRKVLDLLAQAVMPDVYDALNFLQGVAWQVNPLVYEVFTHFWTNDLAVGDLHARAEIDLPPKPSDYAENPEAKKAWKKAARKIHEVNRRTRSDRLSTARLHWTAGKYLEIPQFWFMQQLDWRGRAYPVSYYLHPQSHDLSRSLLQFAEGKPVTTESARAWHSVAGANLWGLDKKPFEERLAWVVQNSSMFTRIAEDPIGCTEWTGADSPWQFLAWCLDWYALQQDPNHLSHLPIHQDATQSGLQIYSMLLRDRTSAEATNCTPSDTPKDLYGLVAKRVSDLLAEQAGEGDQRALRWLEFGIDRAAVKRPVMTRVYNATRHSCRNYVEEWATDQGRSGKVLPIFKGESAIWYLAAQVWEATSQVLDSTARGQEWLTKVAGVFAELGLPMVWTTPLGMPCRQWYPDWENYTVRTAMGDVYRQISLRRDVESCDGRRSVQAFAPNFIHSLDASAMFRTMCIARARGMTSAAAIHDSYATHAADSQILAEATRSAYVEMFQPDVLLRLKTELQAQLPHGTLLPDLPQYGDFDPSEVRNSRYFFN